ncbi:MAG: tRNA adenosine(34) deaminase TadA [Simkania sp.]|nr:tRNA adenosine(34) deaminase TadA [Simkania sp.]
MTDNEAMQLALEQARAAYREGEVPIGAVIVCNDRVIAEAHNEVEKQQDASAHAELLCLQRAARVLGNWRLCEATLYSTLEPCAMCAGAIILYRLKRIVWGARDVRQGAHGSWVDLTLFPHPIHRVVVQDGLLEEESRLLMQSFFRERREHAKHRTHV